MARYCNFFVETPRYERCMNFAESGTSRCAEHKIEKQRRHGDATRAVKEAVRRRDGGKCVLCGKPGFEVDHITELADLNDYQKQFANRMDNLRTLCFECHAKKTTHARRSRVTEADPNDYSLSARARKKRRRRASGQGW